jgi:hypothetical protein
MAQLKQAIMISISKHNCLLILSTLMFYSENIPSNTDILLMAKELKHNLTREVFLLIL